MTDVNREKYVQLMGEIESLEDQIEEAEKNCGGEAVESALQGLREKLAEKRNELARLSDGCGTPHMH